MGGRAMNMITDTIYHRLRHENIITNLLFYAIYIGY